MVVQCPKCKTKYKVSEDVVKDATPAFRCSRCKYTFELEADNAAESLIGEPESPNIPPPGGKEENELSFTFPSPDKEAAPEQEEKSPAESFAKILEHSTNDRELADSWSLNEPVSKTEAPFVISAADETLGNERSKTTSTYDPSDQAPNVYAMTPNPRASTGPFLVLFVLLIVLFSFATAYYQVHPQASEKLVQKIPLLGSSVLKNDHLKQRVLLQSFEANYQTIQGNREVFVVSGVALNQNPVVIREVRIAGQLYNQEGKQIEQQTIWIGNAISPKIVRGMTAQDISDLQRLKPLKTFEIPPGDSVPFTIVFLKPNKTAKDFRWEIVSAEAET